MPILLSPWIPRLRKTLPKKKRVKLSSAGITVRKINSCGVLRVSLAQPGYVHLSKSVPWVWVRTVLCYIIKMHTV